SNRYNATVSYDAAISGGSVSFMPFVVEAGGIFGPSVEKLLVLLEREAAANGNDIGGDFMAWSKRLISIAIIQGNARLASDYLRSFNQHCLRSSVYRTALPPPQPSTRSSSTPSIAPPLINRTTATAHS